MVSRALLWVYPFFYSSEAWAQGCGETRQAECSLSTLGLASAMGSPCCLHDATKCSSAFSLAGWLVPQKSELTFLQLAGTLTLPGGKAVPWQGSSCFPLERGNSEGQASCLLSFLLVPFSSRGPGLVEGNAPQGSISRWEAQPFPPHTSLTLKHGACTWKGSGERRQSGKAL